MKTKKKVIVDTDFMNYMVRAKDGKDDYFEKIVHDLELEPVVHEFLYEKEMMANPLVKKLVAEGKLTVIKYDDFLEEEDASYYSKLFSDLYNYCNERKITHNRFDYRTYQEAGANLGEIHSVILALFTGYPLFFSNDNGAKTMARTKINTDKYSLQVKNIMDVFAEIAVKPEKSLIKKDFVNLTKGDKTRKKQITDIKNMWCGE